MHEKDVDKMRLERRALMRKSLISHRLERWSTIFNERIVSSFEDEKKYLEDQLKKNSNEDDYGELIGLEDDMIEIYNVFCVVLWSCVEPYLKQIGRVLDAEWKDSYRWEEINDCYKDHGVELSKLPRFAEINIIRLINNCVKHNNGFVTKHLHGADGKRFKREIEGKKQRVTLEHEEILAYFSSAEEFLYSLVDACYYHAIAKLNIIELRK
jgi:hypothetical protein